ncbi:hypothetical protein P4S72_07060 [Vibrio sp. PP-XX7]
MLSLIEAVSVADQKKAFAWSKQWALDAIVSTDGDADRPLISDENGQWLRVMWLVFWSLVS